MQTSQADLQAETASFRTTAVHLIVNPGAGDGQPVQEALAPLLRGAGLEWRVSMTHEAGAARRLAEAALAAGAQVIAVYGGDGTVVEVAASLVHTGVPLAVLPGGTANVLAHELGLPLDIVQAAHLLQGGGRLRPIDVGQLVDVAEGNHRYFLTRVGFGITGQSARQASPALKHRWGPVAYLLSGIRSLRKPAVARYALELDGRPVEAEGFGCFIANAGHLAGVGPGLAQLKLDPTIHIGDGWLDVIIMPRPTLRGLLAALAGWRRGERRIQIAHHWRVRAVSVRADPPQPVQADGDRLPQRQIRARVLPHALRVLVPQSPLTPAR
jgi:diacylglycerol kinase (ATP)